MKSGYRTIDFVTIATIGLAFGVVFWAWGKFYALATSFALFFYPPSAALLSGIWLAAGVTGGQSHGTGGSTVIGSKACYDFIAPRVLVGNFDSRFIGLGPP